MTKSFEWNRGSPGIINHIIAGKTIVEIKTPDDDYYMYDWLIIVFTDKSELRIRYDWLYEWCYKESE